MTARKYSIDEIDAMRKTLTHYGSPEGMYCNYIHENGTACYSISSLTSDEVENRLRTYMLAGTDPDELELVLRARYEQARERAADARRTIQKFTS